jgi:hypothetical protein
LPCGRIDFVCVLKKPEQELRALHAFFEKVLRWSTHAETAPCTLVGVVEAGLFVSEPGCCFPFE